MKAILKYIGINNFNNLVSDEIAIFYVQKDFITGSEVIDNNPRPIISLHTMYGLMSGNIDSKLCKSNDLLIDNYEIWKSDLLKKWGSGEFFKLDKIFVVSSKVDLLNAFDKYARYYTDGSYFRYRSPKTDPDLKNVDSKQLEKMGELTNEFMEEYYLSQGIIF